MNTLEIDRHPVAVNVSVTEATLEVELADGRKISAPIVWFPRLEAATEEERKDWHLLGNGQGIHWPQLDEDISVLGLLST
ncbi:MULTISPECIES: DUF2442 domain-containing protein [Idiomarina]|jgi:hypothetical protein|uniref:DUF2442 domain-containing protein n=1 Tax=Idiomarina abyssalis TaxID=86102 RepID=A0A8I1GA68_9GAMM|nr:MULTISPECIES: DUF2442 domain-containing protein [Idiomarina]RDX34498.1 DUF2442 domain-containing protein [Idiomarina sp. HD9-110m-PIT-SAG05]KPD20988.1 hypothetical protein ADS78_09515 [Idiomarina abyssalis]MAL84408.1 DUF2442 domain-containing protein [Idiomarina sp.]MAO67085.1 DUF2442 domain-containing protein [Idiomarina sp.]MBE93362.1 DUF2442 domain-containing protein [Idiomarina sp.]|tara:strand:- start:18 stop:257 length:240 start_codon:yes stop_codon:yes gene_type:complete